MTTVKRRTAAWASAAVIALACGGPSLATAEEGADGPEGTVATYADVPEGTVAVNDLLWRVGKPGESVPWTEANEYCATLEHAGFDDWRLPTLEELRAVHDAAAESGLPAQLELGDCCAWSSTSLAEVPAEAKGELPDPSNDLSGYYWGLLFASGIEYYSFQRFPDGVAMCVREP